MSSAVSAPDASSYTISDVSRPVHLVRSLYRGCAAARWRIVLLQLSTPKDGRTGSRLERRT